MKKNIAICVLIHSGARCPLKISVNFKSVSRLNLPNFYGILLRILEDCIDFHRFP